MSCFGELDKRTRNIHVVFFLCVIKILTRSWLTERGIWTHVHALRIFFGVLEIVTRSWLLQQGIFVSCFGELDRRTRNIVCTRNCYAKLAHRTRNRINET